MITAGGIGGIDLKKLKNLKAYQPPKLDYLAQINISNMQKNRGNLISADATNVYHNPRLIINKNGEFKNADLLDGANNYSQTKDGSLNRNEQTRESL